MEKIKRVSITHVSKKFKIGFKKNQGFLATVLSVFSGKEPQRIIQALEDVSLEVKSGQIVGIIGDNGSGKSTLLRVIAGIYSFDSGKVKTVGKIISLVNLYAGLKERLTMKENIYLIGSLFGLSGKDIKKIFNSIVKFSGLENFINTKIYQFSSGMMQRLVFSVAIYCKPDVLLLDEVFEVGDEEFRKKSVERIKKIAKNGGCVILVSHDMDIIEKNCDEVFLFKNGKIVK